MRLFLVFILFISLKADIKIDFINTMDRVINILSSNKSKEEKVKLIEKTIEPIFDFKLMSKLAIGKNIYNNLTDEEKILWQKAFIYRMKKKYSSKVDSYNKEKIEFLSLEQKGDFARLKAKLYNSFNSYTIVYKYYKNKIYDLEFLGISILKLEALQIRNYLQKHTLKDLITKIYK